MPPTVRTTGWEQARTTLDEAIKGLQEQDARMAEVVQLRFFAGLSVEETAKALEVSERTVKREWAVARAWLYEALREFGS